MSHRFRAEVGDAGGQSSALQSASEEERPRTFGRSRAVRGRKLDTISAALCDFCGGFRREGRTD